MARRLEFSQQFRDGVRTAPEPVRQTLATLLSRLAEDPTDERQRLRRTEAMEFGLRHKTYIVALENVLVTYALPADHPVVLCLSLLWLDPDAPLPR